MDGDYAFGGNTGIDSVGNGGERALTGLCRLYYSAISPLAIEMAQHPAFQRWTAEDPQLLVDYPVPTTTELVFAR
jgi:hypothetical protein